MKHTLLLLILLTAGHSSLLAEVIQKDGKDYLLLPADMLFGKDNFRISHMSLRHAKAFERNDDGHLIISPLYQELYRFDDDIQKLITAELKKIDLALFQHIHKNGKISKDANGIMTFVFSNARSAITPAMEHFEKQVKPKLNEKQILLMKYFDLFDVSKFGGNMRLVEAETTYTLSPPQKEKVITDPKVIKEIEALKAQLEIARAQMHNGKGHDEYFRISKELSKLGYNQGQSNTYSVKYRGGGGSGSSSSSKKSNIYLLFERIYNYHLDGSFE